MVDAAPFRALRYDPAVAGDAALTSAPAYSDFERFTYARHRAASPYTVLELLAPRRGGTDAYAAAGATLRRWRRTGVLVEDATPALYRYEEHELRGGTPTVQRGVLAAVALGPVDGSGDVLPHEDVLPERVGERLERLAAAPVDLAPVFMLYTDALPDLRALLASPPRQRPLVAFTDDAGVDHRVWRIAGPDTHVVRTALSDTRVVIADGHHRYATALAFAASRTPGAAVDPPWRRILGYLVDANDNGPVVLGVHRLLRTAPHDLIARLEHDFTIAPAAADPRALAASLVDAGEIAFGLRLPGCGLLLRARAPAALRARLPPGRSARWRTLDAAVLLHAVLPPLRIPAADIEATPDAAGACSEVDAGAAAALVLLRPVTAATVHALAAAGERMPPKTTWFRPKPRTGLLLRPVV